MNMRYFICSSMAPYTRRRRRRRRTFFDIWTNSKQRKKNEQKPIFQCVFVHLHMYNIIIISVCWLCWLCAPWFYMGDAYSEFRWQSHRAREREGERKRETDFNDNGGARWPIINGFGWPGLTVEYYRRRLHRHISERSAHTHTQMF